MTYTIVAGDTLSRIASRYATTVAKLAADNDIDDPNQIQVGQTLEINAAAAAAPATFDENGNQVMMLPTMTVTAPRPAAFDLQAWLKPPKLYATLAALGIAIYVITNMEDAG